MEEEFGMYCYNCMNEIKEGSFCTSCMQENVDKSATHHLKPGTKLGNKYIVGNVIGEGGFGITYIGLDTTLDIRVAIKEYYPNGRANRNHEATNEITVPSEQNQDFFQKGKEKFLMEARSIAKFNQQKGIVDVRDYFEENGTAYIIMEYLEGLTLGEYVKQNGNIDAKQLFILMRPIMKSLSKMHSAGIIHRDISPDNIMYMKDDTLKLMDFGAARYFLNENNNMSVVLKMGYAPEEQYRKNGTQGPWTDVYGMCATMYRCITGKTPEDALDRLHIDNIKRPSELGISIAKQFEVILMYGLAVHRENRCKDMDELIDLTDKALRREEIELQRRMVSNEDIYKTSAADEDYRTQAADEFYAEPIPNRKPISQYTPNVPRETKKENSNNQYMLLIVILITICVFAIVGCVMFLVLSNGDSKETSSNTTIESQQEEEDVEEVEEEKEVVQQETNNLPPQNNNNNNQQDYVLPGSDSRLLSMQELMGMTAEDCRIARNEIYARHGRMFKDEALQSYFNAKSWYRPTIPADAFTEDMLNQYEIANRDLIVQYETSQGYR